MINAMKTYTPGPWQVIDNRDMNGNYWIGTDAWTSHAEVRMGGGEARELGDELANAKLIAAAPDLLASLQEIVREWGRPNTQKWHRARAAIDKATE